jgi:cell division protein ZapA
MSQSSKSTVTSPVFIKLLNRGFHTLVPAGDERYYHEGYKVFLERMEQHKANGSAFDDIEAIALTSLDCLVAIQRYNELLGNTLDMVETRVDKLDKVISKSL